MGYVLKPCPVCKKYPKIGQLKNCNCIVKTGCAPPPPGAVKK